ncbi:hypothetical protein L873DRAFT_537552 [Choiromyces venosus 120613-1]|uniref:Uncharacterized protein n=1 Tax=Choiromyces venosus 120613-1 TaxID=1336337 RepID=A0A3N4K5E7_9PEZI|nr:hypothetical protein L873DRAFT_537552 [Choiromyces venosus 120613-1]
MNKNFMILQYNTVHLPNVNVCCNTGTYFHCILLAYCWIALPTLSHRAHFFFRVPTRPFATHSHARIISLYSYPLHSTRIPLLSLGGLENQPLVVINNTLRSPLEHHTSISHPIHKHRLFRSSSSISYHTKSSVQSQINITSLLFNNDPWRDQDILSRLLISYTALIRCQQAPADTSTKIDAPMLLEYSTVQPLYREDNKNSPLGR